MSVAMCPDETALHFEQVLCTLKGRRVFRIAHISDLHCGSPYFVADLMERAIMEINELEPQIVVCSGDLTAYGFKQEYAEAKDYL